MAYHGRVEIERVRTALVALGEVCKDDDDKRLVGEMFKLAYRFGDRKEPQGVV